MLSQILDTGQGGASQQLNYFPVLKPPLYEAEPHLERTETEQQTFAFQSSPAIGAQIGHCPQRDEPQLVIVMQTSAFRLRLKDLELGGEPGSNSKLQASLCQTELAFISKAERKMKCERRRPRQRRREQQKAPQHSAPAGGEEAAGPSPSLVLLSPDFCREPQELQGRVSVPTADGIVLKGCPQDGRVSVPTADSILLTVLPTGATRVCSEHCSQESPTQVLLLRKLYK